MADKSLIYKSSSRSLVRSASGSKLTATMKRVNTLPQGGPGGGGSRLSTSGRGSRLSTSGGGSRLPTPGRGSRLPTPGGGSRLPTPGGGSRVSTAAAGAASGAVPRLPKRAAAARLPSLQRQASGQVQRPSSANQPPALIPPSKLKLATFKQALGTLEGRPRQKARAVGAATSKTSIPLVATKRGLEPVLQQVAVEKSVQRTPKAEYVSKYIRGVDVDDQGAATQIELTCQTIDPAYATEDAGVNEVVSTTSSISITAKGKIISKGTTKKSLQATTPKGINMNPAQISRLVKEENEDVENTLKMAPPDLITGTTPEKFPLKKKLHMLRLNSESMGLLEKSVAYPTPTADEVDSSEAPPEVMANLVHAIEQGAAPQSEPNQIFNSLFPEEVQEKVNVSSASTGPLEDVVIPVDPPVAITCDAILNDDMEKIIVQVINTLEPPTNDIATENNIAPQRWTPKQPKTPTLVCDEIPPWGVEDIEAVSALVGSRPIFITKPTDTAALGTGEQINEELSKGIDYFLEANTAPYETRVQIRGSRLPSWFPGYMSAFPHLPDVVKISRTPSVVLHSAWRAVQPKIFPEDSLLIM